MMVGRQEGRFLELLVFAAQATSVLEIGTFTGYSSIAMAAGLPDGGSIISLEVDGPITPPRPGGTSRRRAWSSRISVIEGPALESLEEFERALRPRLHRRRQGQLRRLLRGGSPQAGPPWVDRGGQHPPGGRGARRGQGPAARRQPALRAFNDKVVDDPRVVCVLTTIRDGVTLIRRTG